MPKLFVSPDWEWPSDVLDSWLARAGARPLHSYITINEYNSEELLDKRLKAITPYLQRIETLHIQLQGFSDLDFPASFSAIFPSHPLPLIKSLIITGQGARTISFNPDHAPLLRTFHSSGRSVALLSEGQFSLNSLGWIIKSKEDLKSLADTALSQTTPFHLVMYAHRSQIVDSSITIRPELHPVDCWRNVISLLLHGYRERDWEEIGGLVSQLEMTNLRSLELMELSNRVFSVFVECLPAVTNRRVENLLLACVEPGRIASLDFFSPILDGTSRDDKELPFPNLSQFVLCDLLPESRCKWEVDCDVIKRFIEPRRDILKRLVLPSSFRPIVTPPEDYNNVEEDPLPFPDVYEEESLSLAEQLTLTEVGNLEEVWVFVYDRKITVTRLSTQLPQIKYDFEIDHHGFDIKLPRYS